MPEERNQFQITKKDARNCFVESLSDYFGYEKIHLNFVTYDVNRPEKQRQTNRISIFIAVDEFLELCRKLECGELKYILQTKKKNNDKTPIFESLGGTSSGTLSEYGRARQDGKCLSRTVKLVIGESQDLLFVADSGPGEQTKTGLIVPRFGNKPENHVAVSMTFETLSELLLLTKVHYMAWRTAWYSANFQQRNKGKKCRRKQRKVYPLKDISLISARNKREKRRFE